MSFFQRMMSSIRVWMSGRNGFDQLSFATLAASLILQIIGSFTGAGIIAVLSLALYILTIFRVFSRRSYKRAEENTKFLTLWVSTKTKVKQFFMRLKLRKQYKYFRCPKCKTLIRAGRGGGEKDISCPKCRNEFKVKT